MNEHCPADIPGRFALNMRMQLLQSALAAWPRRGKTLLEVNSGDGAFLPMLWECGFDVTAVEHNPLLREQAVAAVGCRVAVEAAADDHLPFEDNAFDHVILHVTAPDFEGFAASVREALRTAACGLIVTYWNSTSLPYALHRLGLLRSFQPTPIHSWRQVRSLLTSFRVGRLHSMTTLVLPFTLPRRPRDACACLRALPVGAWGVFRLDLTPSRPVTPLPLYLHRRKLQQAEPAMEYSRKNAVPPRD